MITMSERSELSVELQSNQLGTNWEGIATNRKVEPVGLPSW